MVERAGGKRHAALFCLNRNCRRETWAPIGDNIEPLFKAEPLTKNDHTLNSDSNTKAKTSLDSLQTAAIEVKGLHVILNITQITEIAD